LLVHILALSLVLSYGDVVEAAPLPSEAESLAAKQKDPPISGVGNTKRHLLVPAQSLVMESVATGLQLLASPTRKPIGKPKPSNAPSFEPTSFTVPPTNLYSVLPTLPSKAPVVTGSQLLASPSRKPILAT
jgi:hypothetical protein